MNPYLMFILFFGTRPGKTRESVLHGVPCPYCGQVGQLNAVVQPRFVHIFWIPVYRLSHAAFIQCGHCKKAYEGNECSAEMQKALETLKNE